MARQYRSPFASRDAEITRLKAEIEQLHDKATIEKFASELCDNIGVMLAVTPFDKWPDMAKTAYRHAERKLSVGAYLYMDLHKRRNQEGGEARLIRG